MRIAYSSNKGRERDKDEDSIAVLKASSAYEGISSEKHILLLADGVGGSPSGEMASYLATKYMASYVLPELLTKEKEVDYATTLYAGVKETNKKILDYALRNPQHAGMATTLVAAVILRETMYAACVGDSRIYVITEGGIRQLSGDHTDEEGILLKVVGYQPDVEADIFRAKLRPGDYVLLCCDGLSDQVRDDEIREIVEKTNDVDKACVKLVDLANERGGKDNISLILLEVC